MALVTKEFDNYQIFYFSDGGNEAIIECHIGEDGVGRITFYPDDKSSPGNHFNAGSFRLYYPLRRFNDVISILREEKPLYLNINTSTQPVSGFVSTRQEPVGEEES